MLMLGAWVREPCLHRWYLGGASQPNRPRQAVAGSERGQSQPPRRAVRSTHEPVFWRHCHCRITESRQRLTWPLRTQVWASLFSRSRPLGPMLPASARALWPFFVRSARPARHRVPGSPRRFAGSSLTSHSSHHRRTYRRTRKPGDSEKTPKTPRTHWAGV